MADFTRHLPFFARLDALLDDLPVCTGEWFLATIPVREMRRHLQVMTYLGEKVGIVLSPEAKRDAAERERIADIIRRTHAAPFGSIVRAYADTLVDRGCRLSTQRQYLSSAFAFCEASGVVNSGWKEEALASYLDRYPGQRHNLGVFVRFCQKAEGWPVAAGTTNKAVSAASSPAAVRFKEALVKLQAQGDKARPSDVAKLLARAFALPLTALRTAQLHRTPKSLFLVTQEGRHQVPDSLHALAIQWEAGVRE